MNHHGFRRETSPRESVQQLAGEIATLREELAGLVAELDRRRHDALDVKLQIKRHGVEMALTAAALVAAAVGLVRLGAWRSRPREVLPRTAKLRRAVSRVLVRPERPAAEPSLVGKILTATASAAAVTLVKKMLERALDFALNMKQERPRRLLRSLAGRLRKGDPLSTDTQRGVANGV